jgi:hypothetical protein
MSRTSEPLMPAPQMAAPGDDLAIKGIHDEGHADDIAVPAGEL